MPHFSSGDLSLVFGNACLDLCVVSRKAAKPLTMVDVVKRMVKVAPGYKNQRVRTLTASNKAVSDKKRIRIVDGRMLFECSKNERIQSRMEQTADTANAARDDALRTRGSSARAMRAANCSAQYRSKAPCRWLFPLLSGM